MRQMEWAPTETEEAERNDEHQPLAPAVPFKRQEVFVNTYKTLVEHGPFAILFEPGSSYSVNASIKLGADVIATAFTAAAHGIPVPSGLLASVTPELQLQIKGTLSATDTGKTAANLKLNLTGGASTGIGANAIASAKAWAGGGLSITGRFTNPYAFAAYFTAKIMKLLSPFAGSRYRKREKEDDLEAYKWIREQAKKRRTNVVGIPFGGGAEAKVLSLFGAGADVSFEPRLFMRKRNVPDTYQRTGSKMHEFKIGGTADASAHIDLGALDGWVTLTIVHNDANPDNDGAYLSVELSGAAAAALELVQAVPEQLADLTVSLGEGDTMELLKSLLGLTLTTTISRAKMPVGINAGGTYNKSVTLMWYKSGKLKDLTRGASPFRLQYARTTKEIGAEAGVSDIPISPVTLGATLGGAVRSTRKEELGHHTISYLQARYQGFKGYERPPWLDEQTPGEHSWQSWAVKHQADLVKMMESDNVSRELEDVAAGLVPHKGQPIVHKLREARRNRDHPGWLSAVEALFDLEAERRKGVEGVSEGWHKIATPADIWRAGVPKREARAMIKWVTGEVSPGPIPDNARLGGQLKELPKSVEEVESNIERYQADMQAKRDRQQHFFRSWRQRTLL
ncbi:hypothetical protein [Microbulbifer taiwanensis]